MGELESLKKMNEDKHSEWLYVKVVPLKSLHACKNHLHT